jgi:hypothetical protein
VSSDLDSIARTVRQGEVVSNNRICFQIVHLVESLQKPDRYIRRLSNRELLPKTYSRASVKWQEFPPYSSTLESFGIELFSIFPPNILSVMHYLVPMSLNQHTSVIIFWGRISQEPLRTATGP